MGARRAGRKRDRQLGINRKEEDNPLVGALMLIAIVVCFVYGCVKLERGDEDTASGVGYLVPLSLVILYVLYDRIRAYCRRSTVMADTQPPADA